jgi:OOP family OmpA-OmpF porin
LCAFAPTRGLQRGSLHVRIQLVIYMRFARIVGIPGIFMLASTLSHPAFADDTGWYAGFGAGQSRSRLDEKRIGDSMLGGGVSSTPSGDDAKDFGYKLFGGYELNRHLSLEGGYFDLGRFTFSSITVPPGRLQGDIKVEGMNLDAVGSLPLTDRFSLFGRIGGQYAKTREAFAGTGAAATVTPRFRKHDLDYKFGFGAQYDMTPSLGMRLEAERYHVAQNAGSKGNIDLLSAGLVYRFGRTAPVAVPVARVYTPEPVAVAPAPPPVEVAPPPPPPPPPAPVRRKVSFSADALFDFGKEDIRPAGRQELDRFAQELKGSQFDDITVTGYTDRIGSAAYNQKLSTRRAEAVRDYLVTATGIPSSKITPRGAAGSDPVTKPSECPGQQRTPKLVACLQPDRRVEVEVNGTQLQAAPRN